jgi:hypothetical protein
MTINRCHFDNWTSTGSIGYKHVILQKMVATKLTFFSY